MLEMEDIKKILPHREPFLFLDRILELEKGKRVVGIKNIRADEPYFKGHFPGNPIMPGVLIIESMAQAGALLNIVSQGLEGDPQGTLIYFMGMEKVKFRKPVYPNDQLKMDVVVTHKHRRGWKMRGQAYVGEKMVAEAELLAYIGKRNLEQQGESQ